MTLQRLARITHEASLLAADLTVMLTTVALCKLFGHPEPLVWQDMSTGTIGVCKHCSSTVVT